MAKKFDWAKPVAKKPDNDLPKVNFSSVMRKHKQKTTILTARGTPDIKELRAQVERQMKKLRNGA